MDQYCTQRLDGLVDGADGEERTPFDKRSSERSLRVIETPGGIFVAASSPSGCATTIPEMCSLRVTPGPEEFGVPEAEATAALVG